MGGPSALVRRIGVCAIAGLVVGAPAAAAAGDPYSATQKRVQYTVYEPRVTLGMVRESGSAGFQTYPCSLPGGPGFSAAYSQSSTRNFSLNESQRGCLDGPDGVGRYGTISVGSATATISGSCASQASTCASSTAAGVTRQAYTTVTLPAVKGHRSTLVELYTTGLSPRQIAQILRGLVPVTSR